MAAAMPEAALPDSDEGDEDTAWRVESDPVRLKIYRTEGKGSHTKATKTAYSALRIGENSVLVRDLRKKVVDRYVNVVQRHERYLQIMAHLSKEPVADNWLDEISNTQAACLNAIDNYLKRAPDRSTASTTSRHSSRRSSTSSARAKLQKIEHQQMLAELQLQQAEEEESIQEEENAALRQMADYKRKVAAERRRRELRDEIEKQKFSGAILRKMLDEIEEEASSFAPPLSTDADRPTDSARDEIVIDPRKSMVSYSPKNRVHFSGDKVASIAIDPPSVAAQHSQSFALAPVSTRRQIGGSAAPVSNLLATFRGFASRALNVFTPKRQRSPSTPSGSSSASSQLTAPALLAPTSPKVTTSIPLTSVSIPAAPVSAVSPAFAVPSAPAAHVSTVSAAFAVPSVPAAPVSAVPSASASPFVPAMPDRKSVV